MPGTSSTVPIITLDGMPQLVAAGGGVPVLGLPLDGVDIAAALAGGSLPERTMFLRYKNMDQKAVRRGNYKYLSINGKKFLFDVIKDPLERANLKERFPEVFADLRSNFERWDFDMLHIAEAPSYGISPANMADHFEVTA